MPHVDRGIASRDRAVLGAGGGGARAASAAFAGRRATSWPRLGLHKPHRAPSHTACLPRQGPHGTSAQRSRACACATAASRPSCGSSPSEWVLRVVAGRGYAVRPSSGGSDPPTPPTARCWRASSTRCRSASRTGRSLPISWTRTTRKVGPGLQLGFPFPLCRGPPSQHSSLTPCTEYKRARHEIKKKSSDTLKLQKKARKGRAHGGPRMPRGAPLSILPHPVGCPRVSYWLEGPYPGHRTLQPAGWDRGSLPAPQTWPRPSPLREAAGGPGGPGIPHPCPRSGSIHPAVFHTFFLSLSLLLSSSHILPVELLGKSNVHPSSRSSRPCPICLSPPAQGHWKESLQAKEERGRRSVHRGRGLGHSPPGALRAPVQG